MDKKNLLFFTGEENSFTVGLPEFSFFNRRSQQFNYYKYMKALDNNQIVSHTHFCRNNFNYEIPEISNSYTLKLNDILNNQTHHLIHGIFIYLFDSNFENIINIQIKIGDAIFNYDFCNLLFIQKKKMKQLFCKVGDINCLRLPLELFDHVHTWINLVCGVPIELIINLQNKAKIRIDFLTITLDNFEYEIYKIKNNYDCITKYNEILKYNIKNMNEQITFDLSNIKNGIKELSLFIYCESNNCKGFYIKSYQENNIYSSPEIYIKSVKLCINNKNKITEIEYDALQLLCSNKNNNDNNNLLYELPLSLFPENYHPSGDFFVNDFNVSLIVSLNEIYNKNFNCDDNIYLILAINKMQFIRYYIDNGIPKCKFMNIHDISNKNY